MIVLNLICSNQHRFEGWFASREAFVAQAEHRQLICPFCCATDVAQLPSAPYVKRQSGVSSEPPLPDARDLSPEAAYMAMLSRLYAESEDVGERFPEEARRIHYEETPARKIRGKSSRAEAVELLEEGIPVLPLPIPPGSDVH